MVVYLKTADFAARRAQTERSVAGRLSMFRLLHQQRVYCALNPRDADEGLQLAEREQSAHLAAPPGTSLVSVRGESLSPIWVVGNDRKEIYFGPPEGYPGR